jgi:hypothetical protein
MPRRPRSRLSGDRAAFARDLLKLCERHGISSPVTIIRETMRSVLHVTYPNEQLARDLKPFMERRKSTIDRGPDGKLRGRLARTPNEFEASPRTEGGPNSETGGGPNIPRERTENNEAPRTDGGLARVEGTPSKSLSSGEASDLRPQPRSADGAAGGETILKKRRGYVDEATLAVYREADTAISMLRPVIEPHLEGQVWDSKLRGRRIGWVVKNKPTIVEMVLAGLSAEQIVAAHSVASKRLGFVIVLAQRLQRELSSEGSVPAGRRTITAAERGLAEELEAAERAAKREPETPADPEATRELRESIRATLRRVPA